MSENFVLLVEDNPDDVALAQMAFRKCRISNTLAVATDGEEALDFLFNRGKHDDLAYRQEPALVLLDLKLPCVSGLEVLHQIRTNESTRSIPVVVLTSSVEDTDREASLHLGANNFYVKPVNFGEFLGLVQQISTKWLNFNRTPGDCLGNNPV
jgi:two-component system, response regulator